jgi:hypothetical protein
MLALAASLLIVAIAGAGALFDFSSHIAFTLLTGKPVIPWPDRLFYILPNSLVAMFSGVTSSSGRLIFLNGAVYAFITFAIIYRIILVCQRDHVLLVCALAASTLLVLPQQINLGSDVNITSQLFILGACCLARQQYRGRSFELILVGLTIATLHPVGIVLLAVLAGQAALIAFRDRARQDFVVAIVLFTLAGARLFLNFKIVTGDYASYVAGESSLNVLIQHLHGSVLSNTDLTAALVISWITIQLAVLTTFAGSRWILLILTVLGFVVSSVFFVRWGGLSENWSAAVDFRRFVWLVCLSAIAPVTIVRFFCPAPRRHPLWAICCMTVIVGGYCTTLLLQGSSLSRIRNDIAADLKANSKGYVFSEDLDPPRGTALRGVHLPFYALLQQKRAVETLVFPEFPDRGSAAALDPYAQFHGFNLQRLGLSSSWFSFAKIAELEDFPAQAGFIDGAHPTESPSVANIRWIKQSSTLRVDAPNSGIYRIYLPFAAPGVDDETVSIYDGSRLVGSVVISKFINYDFRPKFIEMQFERGSHFLRLQASKPDSRLGLNDARSASYLAVNRIRVVQVDRSESDFRWLNISLFSVDTDGMRSIGFYSPESLRSGRGRWTSDRACLESDIQLPRQFELSIKGWGLDGPASRSAMLDFRGKLYPLNFSTLPGWQSISIGGGDPSADNEICFAVGQPESPRQASGQNDDRLLGVFLQNIVIRRSSP